MMCLLLIRLRSGSELETSLNYSREMRCDLCHKARFFAQAPLTLYAGAKSPGADKENDWLPAPDGTFSLYIRAYWGKESILDGSGNRRRSKSSNERGVRFWH
jgi:hypothetical protein